MMRSLGSRAPGGNEGVETGAAIADFAMVTGLLMFVFAAVFQLGLTLHIRNTLISCAAEGARVGARVDAAPGDAVARTTQMIDSAISSRFSQNVTSSTESVDGIDVVVVRVTAPLPLIGPLGPDNELHVTGRAFEEAQ